jgi:16S rRNA processing protein RimM
VVVHLQGKAGSLGSWVVERVRLHAPLILVKLQDIDSLEQAVTVREAIVSVAEHQLPPLQDGEFYYSQVIGLTVLTTAGEKIGTIAQVFFSGGHDVWVVRHGKQEHLIPVIDEIVRSIDISSGQAIIEPIAGLLE